MTIFERVEQLEAEFTALSGTVATQQNTIASLEETLDEILLATEDSGWIALPLANGVSAYNTANTPQYRKIGNVVAIRGTVKGITARNTTIATLPEGYRPNKAEPFVQNTSLGTGNTATTTRMTVTTTGEVQLQAVSENATFGADKWFPIGTMFFIG